MNNLHHEEIASVKFGNNRRTYFVDVKAVQNKREEYLVITETEKVKDKYEKRRVMFFEEDIQDLFAAIDQIKKHFPKKKI